MVTVNIYLRSISKIDDVNMEYSAQFTFREEWVDARLAYERYEDDNTEVRVHCICELVREIPFGSSVTVKTNNFDHTNKN